MIYVMAIIKAKTEYQNNVAVVLHNMVKETRKEYANILYDLHQSLEHENTFVFYEI